MSAPANHANNDHAAVSNVSPNQLKVIQLPVLAAVPLVATETRRIRVGISWRADGGGKGAFWDHYTVRMMIPQSDTFILRAQTETDART